MITWQTTSCTGDPQGWTLLSRSFLMTGSGSSVGYGTTSGTASAYRTYKTSNGITGDVPDSSGFNGESHETWTITRPVTASWMTTATYHSVTWLRTVGTQATTVEIPTSTGITKRLTTITGSGIDTHTETTSRSKASITTVTATTSTAGTSGIATDSDGFTQTTIFRSSKSVLTTINVWTTGIVDTWFTTYPVYSANGPNELLWVLTEQPSDMDVADTSIYALTDIAASTNSVVVWVPIQTTVESGFPMPNNTEADWEITAAATRTLTGTEGETLSRNSDTFTMPDSGLNTSSSAGDASDPFGTANTVVTALGGDGPNITTEITSSTAVPSTTQNGFTSSSTGSSYETYSTTTDTDGNTVPQTIGTIKWSDTIICVVQAELGIAIENSFHRNTNFGRVGGLGIKTQTRTAMTSDTALGWITTVETVSTGQHLFRAPGASEQSDAAGSNLSLNETIYFPESLFVSCQLGVLVPLMVPATAVDSAKGTWLYRWLTGGATPTVLWTHKTSQTTGSHTTALTETGFDGDSFTSGTVGSTIYRSSTGDTTSSGTMGLVYAASSELCTSEPTTAYTGMYGICGPTIFGGVGEWSTADGTAMEDIGIWDRTTLANGGGITEGKETRVAAKSETFHNTAIVIQVAELAMQTAAATNGQPGVFLLPRNDLWTNSPF